ncbi:MAG: trypsin-like peptidase domain-containing protein [Sphingomonadaceae bacterium]
MVNHVVKAVASIEEIVVSGLSRRVEKLVDCNPKSGGVSPKISPAVPASAVNPLSLTTTKIDLLFNDTPLGSGSGFILEWAGHYGLVTNWHVVSGRNPLTGQCHSRTGAIPNRVKFNVALEKTYKSEKALKFHPVDIRLYRDNCLEKPRWVDDREQDDYRDYVILPLKLSDALLRRKFTIKSIRGGNVIFDKSDYNNEQVHYKKTQNVYPSIGRQVFILGYPSGIEPTGVLPIWKGGTIASEPYSAHFLSERQTLDAFLVDGLTRSGMSGAPVIRLVERGEMMTADDGFQVPSPSDQNLLLGVYAGREGVTKYEADLALGRVWKIGALERLFRRMLDDRVTEITIKP